MYANYWGLADSPFACTLDTHWFYQSPGHEEALARLLYLVEQRRRCGVLVGQAGTGKSLLLRVLATEARRLPCEVALIDLIGRSTRELIWETTAALGLGPRTNDPPRVLWRILQDHIAASRLSQMPTVLLFDHLDRAEPECIGAIERLCQGSASADNGLTLIVSTRSERIGTQDLGLTELADLQVELSPLDREETTHYIESLLKIAGANRAIIDERACERLYAETLGVARDLNRLCDLAMVTGMAEGALTITESTIAAAASQWHPARRPLAPHMRRSSGHTTIDR